MYAALEATGWLLGCRGDAIVEWMPWHLENHLDCDNVIEAWLLAKLRAGIDAIATGSKSDTVITGPMGGDASYRSRPRCGDRPNAEGGFGALGPKIWEGMTRAGGVAVTRCGEAWDRSLATAGVTHWAHITASDGAWRTWSQMQETYPALAGLYGKGERDTRGRYERVLNMLNGEDNA